MTDSGSGNSYPGDFVCEHIIGGGCELLLQLNNVEDGLGDGRRFELFFDGRVVGVKEFFDLVSDPDDKGEGPFEEQGNCGHLSEDIGSMAFEDSGFV